MVKIVDAAYAKELAEQGGYTAELWMMRGVKYIDELFGKGYAEKHPELLGHFMQAAALDQMTAYLKFLVESTGELENLSGQVGVMARNLGELSESVSEVAANIPDMENIADALKHFDK